MNRFPLRVVDGKAVGDIRERQPLGLLEDVRFGNAHTSDSFSTS